MPDSTQLENQYITEIDRILNDSLGDEDALTIAWAVMTAGRFVAQAINDSDIGQSRGELVHAVESVADRLLDIASSLDRIATKKELE